MSDPLIRCPFCGEDDFDLVGLKLHFEMGWCEVYENTDPPPKYRPPSEQPEPPLSQREVKP